MIEILSDDRTLEPLEEGFIAFTLGSTIRNFAGHIRRARVRIGEKLAGADGLGCEILIDTPSGPIHVEGTGRSRTHAFMRAAEQLDRRILELIHLRPERDGPSESLAA